MKMSPNRRNLTFVSIREGHSQNVLSGTNEDEKEQVPVLDVEALRTIGRIVREIKRRIDAATRTTE